LSVPNIQNCIANSNKMGTQGAYNSILDSQLQQQGLDSVYYIPTFVIDDEEYTGSMRCDSPVDIDRCETLSAICAAYPAGNAPAVCGSSTGCSLGLVRDGCGVCGGVSTGQLDACGVCLSPTSAAFNRSCAGCDGVPNSGKRVDACGVCGGSGTSFDQCVSMTPLGSQVAAAVSQVATAASTVASVNLTVYEQLALLRAELATLRASLNPACVANNPQGPSSGATRTQAVNPCPATDNNNNGNDGSSKQTVAIVVAILIVGLLLGGGIGVIVWRRRHLNRTHVTSSLDNETSTTGGDRPKHTLLVDREDSETGKDQPAASTTHATFTEAEPPKPTKPTKSKKVGKTGNVEINVPLMDKSTDEDL